MSSTDVETMNNSNQSVDKSVRIRAFLIHLAISFTILFILLAVIFFVWFPNDFILVGGTEGLLILAGVDLVIGPLLTLIIFNPRKRRVLINFDLTCIGLTQLACIIYGLSLIFPQRPLLQILADDGVHIYTAAELQIYKMDLEPLDLPDSPPHNILLDLPSDQSSINSLKMVHELLKGKPFALSEDLYLSVSATEHTQITQRVTQIESRIKPQTAQFIDGLDKQKDCTWLPLFSIHARGAVCYNPEKGVTSISTI